MTRLLVLLFGPCAARKEADSAPLLGQHFTCTRQRGHKGDHLGVGLFGLTHKWPA